jgi:hypothetical protein
MTDFLKSVKADLLDRRMLPLVAVVAVALVAAVAYVVLGGSSSTTTPASAVATPPAATSTGIAATQASPEKAVAEVTSGTSAQHRGSARNPFTPLPEKKAKAATASGTSASSTSSAGSSNSSVGSGSGSSSSSSGASTPATPAAPVTPSTPAKPKTVYHVAVLFGALPVTTTPLTPYANLKLLTPLPSSAQPLLVFRGVTAGGKSATFTLVGEAPILKGEGACLPSASQCEALDLQPGKAEQLEYLSPSGQTISYELQVVSIASSKASSAAFKDSLSHESKAGRELLRHAGLTSIPYLHYSAQMGVLVFAGHSSFGTGAHAAAHGRHGR